MPEFAAGGIIPTLHGEHSTPVLLSEGCVVVSNAAAARYIAGMDPEADVFTAGEALQAYDDDTDCDD